MMWIRSQNEEILMQVDVLEISEYGISKPKAYNIESHCYVLGTYSTKEKALKVLDEIEETMCCGNEFYQMPENDEVEE